MVLIKVTIVLQCTRDIVIKGAIQRDFWFLVLFVNEPIWTTDQRVKYFKILFKIVPSYSNFKLEKKWLARVCDPGEIIKKYSVFQKTNSYNLCEGDSSQLRTVQCGHL